MSSIGPTILIIEDDASLRRSLSATLKAAGYKPVEAVNGGEGLRWIPHYKPNLILLDLGLPDGDGLGLIPIIRKDSAIPILVLSARDAEAAKVTALDLGADDYVTKPFGVEELMARVRASLRHGVQVKGATPTIKGNGLEIDLSARTVKREGEEITLSPKEFDVLAVLAMRSGMVVRHKEILDSVWGAEAADIQYLRVYIAQLRSKLEDKEGGSRRILSSPGVGYRLVLDDSC